MTTSIKFSDIKTIKTLCEDLDSQPCWREVIQNLLDDEDDFEVDNVRFINSKSILSVMVDEIFSDNYILGCFNVCFIANNSIIPREIIEACQQCGAFEAIGKGLNATMSDDEKESFCEEYAGTDGYGHHFNGYDFSEGELITKSLPMFHVFDNR